MEHLLCVKHDSKYFALRPLQGVDQCEGKSGSMNTWCLKAITPWAGSMLVHDCDAWVLWAQDWSQESESWNPRHSSISAFDSVERRGGLRGVGWVGAQMRCSQLWLTLDDGERRSTLLSSTASSWLDDVKVWQVTIGWRRTRGAKVRVDVKELVCPEIFQRPDFSFLNPSHILEDTVHDNVQSSPVWVQFESSWGF